MKTFLNIIKNILASLLGIISCVFIVTYTVLNTTEDLISKENIIDTVKNVDIVELIGEESKQEIYGILQQAEIPTEYIDVMLEDEALKETVGEYVALSLEYVLLEDKKAPELDETEITELLITSFDRVIEEAEAHQIDVSTYITKEDQAKIHEKIEYYVPEVVAKIPEAQEFIENQVNENATINEAKEKMEQIEQTLDKIQMVYTHKNMLLIGVVVPMILIALIKFKKLQFLKWLAFPCILSALIFAFIANIIPFIINTYMTNEIDIIKPVIEPSIQTIITGMNSALVISLVIGIILIIVQMIISIYRKKKEEEIVL